MGKNKGQGTAFETYVVALARDNYWLKAERIAEGGSKDIGDVMLKSTESPLWDTIVAVAWKRLVKGNGERRRPDGVRDTVTITLQDFLLLLGEANLNAIVECKATERLNVTRTLAKAREKVRRNA